MAGMFARTDSFNQDISKWNTKNVVNMHGMFAHAKSFNQNISKWNMKQVTDITNMFAYAESFNQPIKKWNLKNVKIIQGLLHNAKSFNQELPKIDTENNVLYNDIFAGSGYTLEKPKWYNDNGTIEIKDKHMVGKNQVYSILDINGYMADKYYNNLATIDTHYATVRIPLDTERRSYRGISTWDISNIKDFSGFFKDLPYFNEDISSWDVSHVENMSEMFSGALNFNQDISSWNVSNVTNMAGMFSGAESFNQDISSWNVSNVVNMSYMFAGAKSFNQNLDPWDTWRVYQMDHMFEYASKFNGKIDNWDVYGVGDFSSMFYGAASFNQDLSKWASINEWTSEFGPEDRSVEDMFTYSPLENNPPQWYSNMIYDETDDKKEYAFNENTLDSPACEKLSDAGEDGFDPDMWYEYRCVFNDDVSMESVYKGVLKTIADKVSRELEQNNDFQKQEFYNIIKQLQNKEENYSFSKDYGLRWFEIGTDFAGDSIIISTNEGQGEESYKYTINTSGSSIVLTFSYDSGF